jgi:hypothetical protein
MTCREFRKQKQAFVQYYFYYGVSKRDIRHPACEESQELKKKKKSETECRTQKVQSCADNLTCRELRKQKQARYLRSFRDTVLKIILNKCL